MINMLEPVSSGASKAEKKKRKKRKTSTRWIPVGDHPVYRFIWKGGTSGTKHEKPLAFLVTRGERNGKGDALPAVWIPGKQRQDEKKKEKNVSFDNAAISLSPFDLCSPPSNSPRRLFPFFPSPLFTPTCKLSESFLRGNVPIFPVFLEEEKDRRLAKERGRSTDEE